AAEVILEPGADDFLAVIEIFRTDEADHAVDEQRMIDPRHRIGTRLKGLLVDAVMGIGRQRRALPGLEIHHVVADGAARQRTPGVMRFAEQRKVDAKAAIGGLRTGDRLKYQ